MILAVTAPQVVRELIANQNKIFSESRVLQSLFDEDIRYETGFFEAFGEENGYYYLGSILDETDDSGTKESILNILIRAMKAEGDPVKKSILVTMSLLPISNIFTPEADLTTVYIAVQVLITMFVGFTFADYRYYDDPRPTAMELEIMKRSVNIILPMIQIPLLSTNQKVSVAATKTIGFLTKFGSSRFYIKIADYMSEPCYNRIINQIFCRYGEALGTQVYINLLRSNDKAAAPFFTQYNLQRLKESMIKNRLKESMFFVLLNKIPIDALKPNATILCESGMLEFLRSVITHEDLTFALFNRIQALCTIKRVVSHLQDKQMDILVNRDFFKGLDELMKNYNPIPKTKMSILQIVEGILRNGWTQCMRRRCRTNGYAKFVKKQGLHKTIVAIKKAAVAPGEKLLKEKATDIVNKHLL